MYGLPGFDIDDNRAHSEIWFQGSRVYTDGVLNQPSVQNLSPAEKKRLQLKKYKFQEEGTNLTV